MLNLPFVGTVFRRSSTRTIDVFNTVKDQDPSPSGVTAVYQYIAGAVHGRSRAMRNMLEEANSIMKLVGAQGGAENLSAAIPVAGIMPPGKRFQKSMMMSFTLMCDEAAARDIVAAPVAALVKAFAASLDDDSRDLFQKALSVSTINADGSLSYQEGALAAALGVNAEEDAALPCGLLCQIDSLSATAAEIVADVASIRDEKDVGARSARFCQILSGKSQSGLAYADLLRVLVQFVNPADISADLTVHAGGKDAHYSFNAGNASSEAAAIKKLKLAQGRFGAPPVLSD
jgi:hypothetical protein